MRATTVLLAITTLSGLACSGLVGPEPSVRTGVAYVFDRDLQPELGVDVDYQLSFRADGTFALRDEGRCLGRWQATGATVRLKVRSATNPDGARMDPAHCWDPGTLRVESADVLVSSEGYRFVAR